MMGRLACERRLTLSIRACAIAALHRDWKLTVRAVWSALSENADSGECGHIDHLASLRGGDLTKRFNRASQLVSSPQTFIDHCGPTVQT